MAKKHKIEIKDITTPEEAPAAEVPAEEPVTEGGALSGAPEDNKKTDKTGAAKTAILLIVATNAI